MHSENNQVRITMRLTTSPLLQLITVCISLLISATVFADNSKPAIQKKGVTVWKQNIPNTELIGFKAKTVLNAPLKKVYAVLEDSTHAHEWVPRTRSTTLYNNQKMHGQPKVYIILDMPFPFKDRELMVSVKVTESKDGSVYVENKLTNIKGVPFNKKYIRISNYSGSWLSLIHI